jgi:hypothetical protein
VFFCFLKLNLAEENGLALGDAYVVLKKEILVMWVQK